MGYYLFSEEGDGDAGRALSWNPDEVLFCCRLWLQTYLIFIHAPNAWLSGEAVSGVCSSGSENESESILVSPLSAPRRLMGINTHPEPPNFNESTGASRESAGDYTDMSFNALLPPQRSQTTTSSFAIRAAYDS